MSFEQFANADRVVQTLGEYLKGVSFNCGPPKNSYRAVLRVRHP